MEPTVKLFLSSKFLMFVSLVKTVCSPAVFSAASEDRAAVTEDGLTDICFSYISASLTCHV